MTHRPLQNGGHRATHVLRPYVPSVLEVQSEVRAAFGWSVEADLRSATALLQSMVGPAPFGCSGWSPEARASHLSSLRDTVAGAKRVVVVGAAATREAVLNDWEQHDVVVAADGAAGAVPDHLPLAAVVSDLDGAEHLERAVLRRPVVVLHAHGDNQASWTSCLPRWAQLVPDLPLVLTHQTPSPLRGAENPGGFTDGDRAVCLLLSLGVPASRLVLVGFNTDRIGAWSGTTDPQRKMAKLVWMAKVLKHLGAPNLALDEDEE